MPLSIGILFRENQEKETRGGNPRSRPSLPTSKFHALLSECLKSYWLISLLLIFETAPEKHDAENFLQDLIHSVGEILPC